MDVCTSDLQQKLTTLRRAPPKVPVSSVEQDNSQEESWLKVKLRPTKPNECNNENPETNTQSADNKNNNSNVKQRVSSIKERSKAFQNGSPGKTVLGKPAVPIKPVVGAKPTVLNKPPVNVSGSQSTVTRVRPPSVLNKPE